MVQRNRSLAGVCMIQEWFPDDLDLGYSACPNWASKFYLFFNIGYSA